MLVYDNRNLQCSLVVRELTTSVRGSVVGVVEVMSAVR